jgi:hypothetical protein
MATKRKPRKRKSSGISGIPTDSASLQKVGMGAAGAIAGALLGSAVGKLGLLPGIALIGYGALNDNIMAVAAGATMAMAPDVKTAATSTKTGAAGFVENAISRVKESGRQIGQKAYLDKVAPSVFGSSVAGIEGVDYYDSNYQNALNSIAGMDDYSLEGGDMGRLAEYNYQAQELAAMSGIDGLAGDYDDDMAGIGAVKTSDAW